MTPSPSPFYITGGTLRGDAPCYVERQADRDLHDGLSRGEFCYVLTARQMGKSSLMVRTAQRLRQDGAAVAVLDLTALGQNLTAEQWYDGLLGNLGRQLGLEDDLERFWHEHARLGPLERWMRALREVVLPQRPGPVVVFVDEIDFVRSLPFPTDEFFAAIRECYNRRTEDAELNRLTFCLLGVALPSDLIRDTRTTPFNVGRRVELQDFTTTEAAPLARGLEREGTLAAQLLERVLHWTGGHPYLTQRLCQALAEDPSAAGPPDVDRACVGLFLSERARERDDNLLFVRERVLRSEVDRAGLLDLYARVWAGKRVPDEEGSPLVGALRLAGIARARDGLLWVRNRIYARVFDREWVAANMPDAEKRRRRAAFWRGVRRTSAVAAVLVLLAAGWGAWYWDRHFRVHIEYYANLIKRYGAPEGIGPLTEDEVRHRQTSYKFFRRDGLVEKVEAINSHHWPTGRHDLPAAEMLLLSRREAAADNARACRWEYLRDADRRIIYEKATDEAARLVYGLAYTPGLGEGISVGQFTDRTGFCAPGPTPAPPV